MLDKIEILEAEKNALYARIAHLELYRKLMLSALVQLHTDLSLRPKHEPVEAAIMSALHRLMRGAPDAGATAIITALRRAADIFDDYAELHHAKGPAGEQKALINKAHARMCRDALKGVK